jgi:hypothetical protein
LKADIDLPKQISDYFCEETPQKDLCKVNICSNSHPVIDRIDRFIHWDTSHCEGDCKTLLVSPHVFGDVKVLELKCATHAWENDSILALKLDAFTRTIKDCLSFKVVAQVCGGAGVKTPEEVVDYFGVLSTSIVDLRISEEFEVFDGVGFGLNECCSITTKKRRKSGESYVGYFGLNECCSITTKKRRKSGESYVGYFDFALKVDLDQLPESSKVIRVEWAEKKKSKTEG